MSLRIDSHHHLWCYEPEEFSWIGDDLRSLRRDFLMPEFEEVLRSARVTGAVAVQARQSLAETHWLLEMADNFPSIYGVVGWLPLASSTINAVLESFSGSPWLKGVRHVVQAEPEGFLDGINFNAGISRLKNHHLVFDLLITENQLPEATRFVDRHPDQSFVLDHMGKPKVRDGQLQPWQERLRDLARRPNVAVKISGLVTEADYEHWSSESLLPYFEVALEVFGPLRLMVGSDWPVLTVGCKYEQWWSLVESWIQKLSEHEQAAILGGTARTIYKLEVNTEEQVQ